jgi:topoisomerase-4 subunit A
VNLLVIRDGLPAVMSVTEVVEHHAEQLVSILTKELELERNELKDKLHQRTLERIFIEERIYKKIEEMKTAETVVSAVIAGFKPFAAEIGPRGVSEEDVDRLLKIPIRRISLYDINKARAEMKEIEARLQRGVAAGFAGFEALHARGEPLAVASDDFVGEDGLGRRLGSGRRREERGREQRGEGKGADGAAHPAHGKYPLSRRSKQTSEGRRCDLLAMPD